MNDSRESLGAVNADLKSILRLTEDTLAIDATQPEERRKRFVALYEFLLAHIRAFEQTFCSDTPDTPSAVLATADVRREQQRVQAQLETLMKLGARDPRWFEQLARLERALEHLQRARRVLLECAKRTYSEIRLAALDQAYQRAREAQRQEVIRRVAG